MFHLYDDGENKIYRILISFNSFFIVSIFSFAILFRVSEYKIYEGEASITTMYINMFYMTVITMTSVGYGDFKPQSVLGRLTGTICVTWGVLIVSIMVVVLINAFRMDRSTYMITQMRLSLLTYSEGSRIQVILEIQQVSLSVKVYGGYGRIIS